MKRLAWLTGTLLSISVLLGPAAGAEEAQPGGTPPTTPPEQAAPQGGTPADGQAIGQTIDSDAMDRLKRMADTLAQAKGFSVTIQASYDVVQDTGEKIEFGERRAATLSRPDGLRVEAEDSDGDRTEVTFDGKALTVFSPQENVYGQIDQAGTVDDAVHHLVQDLQVRLPMALLLVSTLPDEIERRIQALDYVERDMLTPVPTDHLAARTEDVDFQVWISADDTSLPQRITITYKGEEGQPQYRADFTEWRLNPDVPAARFAFRPPEGAERIPFMVRVPKTAAGQPPATDDTAETTTGASDKAEGTTK